MRGERLPSLRVAGRFVGTGPEALRIDPMALQRGFRTCR